jgi:hypothetical protein
LQPRKTHAKERIPITRRHHLSFRQEQNIRPIILDKGSNCANCRGTSQTSTIPCQHFHKGGGSREKFATLSTRDSPLVEAQPALTSAASSTLFRGRRLGSNLGFFEGKGLVLQVGEEELLCLMYGWNRFLGEEAYGYFGGLAKDGEMMFLE